MMRWHGISSGTGLRPSALPTARVASGAPSSRAPPRYGRALPRPTSAALRSTRCSNGEQSRRSTGTSTSSPCSRARAAVAIESSSTAGTQQRAKRSAYHASKVCSSDATRTADTPQSLHATNTAPSTLCAVVYRSSPQPANTLAVKSGETSRCTASRASRRFASVIVLLQMRPHGEQPAVGGSFDGGDRLIERLRDLLVRQIVDVAHHERRPQGLRQPRDRVADGLPRLGAQHEILRARLSVDQAGARRAVVVLERVAGRRRVAKRVAREVVRDRVQPRAQPQRRAPLRGIRL